MFHRVKSETSQDEVQEQAVETAAAPATEAKAAVSSPVQKSMLDTDIPAEAKPAPKAEASAPKNVYQRTPATSTTVRPGVRYSAKPTASTYSAPKASAPKSSAPAATDDRRLTIGRGITMSGEIEYCDELYVEGTVEAALKGAKDLHIAESGVFYGTVEIEEATISGRFEGEIIVHGRLTVESTGVITGSISYKELALEAGAMIDGRLTPLATAAEAKGHVPAEMQAEETSEGELFTEEAA